ncbi:MAG: hypothetical protein KC684_06360, partial [Candidatus Omnitrophica bacterium]|nr:hypothetical protein [Candidatus Omnitrophota bacterium]
ASQPKESVYNESSMAPEPQGREKFINKKYDTQEEFYNAVRGLCEYDNQNQGNKPPRAQRFFDCECVEDHIKTVTAKQPKMTLDHVWYWRTIKESSCGQATGYQKSQRQKQQATQQQNKEDFPEKIYGLCRNDERFKGNYHCDQLKGLAEDFPAKGNSEDDILFWQSVKGHPEVLDKESLLKTGEEKCKSLPLKGVDCSCYAEIYFEMFAKTHNDYEAQLGSSNPAAQQCRKIAGMEAFQKE